MKTRMSRQTLSTARRAVFLFSVSALSVMMTASVAQLQTKNPYEMEKLLRVVQLNALPTTEVVQAIQQRGVDFQVTSDVESQFRAAGARPEVIGAMRENYRAPSRAPVVRNPTTSPSTSTSKPSPGVPAGAPLSKAEIITLLQSGAPSTRVEQFVEARGVSFSITPQIAREIKDAGGNNSLIGAITAKASEAPAPTHSRQPAPVVPAGPDYDDLTDRAVAAMQANNSRGAIGFLQQAVNIDPAKPQAYGLLGFAQLYGTSDILAAERSMRAAIERGGGAPFRVYHDHDGFFNTFCQGSLFVSKATVTFKGDDGKHTFGANRADIKETKINGFVGSQFGAFHLKVAIGAAKPENFNFAPATRQKAESNLIINLINSYR